MGILDRENPGLVVSELILVRQEVSPVHVDLDMEWWADHQVDLYEQRGIEPWQSSVWLHTHPANMINPSTTDEQTMQASFGEWSFALMLILTKDGQFYARMDYDHEFPGSRICRLSQRCEVIILWNQAKGEPVTEATLKEWEQEFQERVTCREWITSLYTPAGKNARVVVHSKGERSKKKAAVVPSEKEVMDYEEACALFGLDPGDPWSFEAIHGYWPGDFDLF